MTDASPHPDDIAAAVVDLIRMTRADDRLHDGPHPSMRKRIVQSHLETVAKDYGIDPKALALATAEMMSHPEEVRQRPAPQP